MFIAINNNKIYCYSSRANWHTLNINKQRFFLATSCLKTQIFRKYTIKREQKCNFHQMYYVTTA